MTPEFWAIIGVGATVILSRLSLYRDIAALRERNVRLEGKMEILIAAFVKPQQP